MKEMSRIRYLILPVPAILHHLNLERAFEPAKYAKVR